MPFIKKNTLFNTTETVPAAGIVAAAATLAGEMEKIIAPRTIAAAKGRDFDAEARGKTRCALEEAWAQSPLLPMLVKDPNDRAELHLILDEIVTERMKRVFPNG